MNRIPATMPQWTAQDTLLLRVPPTQWPPPGDALELDGIDFAPKRELHVTVVGRTPGHEVREAMHADPMLAKAMSQLTGSLDWSCTRGCTWLRLEKHAGGRTVGSIIELVDLPAMAAFHARLAVLLGRTCPVPPPHVTLFTAGDARGIGLADDATLQRLTVRAVAASELGAAAC